MSQHRWALIEALTNTVAGYGVSVTLTWWLFGVSWSQSAGLSVWYVMASIARGYVVRRAFARWTGSGIA